MGENKVQIIIFRFIFGHNMDNFNPSDKIMDHVEVLAERIGPRAPTSENERKAAEYVRSYLREKGLGVQIDEFRSPSTFSWYYAVPSSIILVSFLIFSFHQLLGLLVSILGAFFFMMEINSIETISRIYPKGKSQNVIGKIKPKSPMKRRVIIVAHHDTSKPSISFHPRLVKHFRASIVLLIFSMLFIPILFAFALLSPFDYLAYYISVPFSIYLLMSILVLVHREVVYEPVKGANDNASGVGVLLALAESISNSPLEKTEIWLLYTGCEEVGMIGMIRFIKKYGKELKDAFIINIDNVGKGLIRFTTKEGLVKAFKCSEPLIELARHTASKNDIVVKEFVSKAYPTNALPCLVRGYQVISILGTDESGSIHNWHWRTDTIENLDEKTMEDAYHLVYEMVKSLDVEG